MLMQFTLGNSKRETPNAFIGASILSFRSTKSRTGTWCISFPDSALYFLAMESYFHFCFRPLHFLFRTINTNRFCRHTLEFSSLMRIAEWHISQKHKSSELYPCLLCFFLSKLDWLLESKDTTISHLMDQPSHKHIIYNLLWEILILVYPMFSDLSYRNASVPLTSL